MSVLPVALRTLAIVQAGGQGSRMDVLTRERAKPTLPFAATHALIDFPLSSLRASGISDVWVSVQYQASSMDTYLAGGRPWDLDRTYGGFRRVTPEEGSGTAHEDGFSHGNADGLFRMRDLIAAHGPDVLAVLSADHVFSVDLRPVIARHLERGAECTLLTSEVGVQEAAHNLVVDADRDGRVTSVAYKPDRAAHGVVGTEVFLYDPAALLAELDRLWTELHPAANDDEDTGLGDFGEHLLPALVRRGRVWAEEIGGYWKDVGRPEAYLQAHRDLVTGTVDVFDHSDRPVLGPSTARPPGWIGPEAQVVEAMVGPGCRVRGTVRRSVLGPDVEVQAGAVVEDSVLLGSSVVAAGAHVRTAIVDTGVRIGRGARVGEEPAGTRLTGDAVTLVGRDSSVAAGTVVPAGGRLEPGTTA